MGRKATESEGEEKMGRKAAESATHSHDLEELGETSGEDIWKQDGEEL